MTMWRNKSGQHGEENENLNGAVILPRVATNATPVPDPDEPPASQTPAVLLAMCLFGEARGESEAALRAVAQVVLNRARHPHPVFGSRSDVTWEENLRRVILRPGQFSCFHPSDPNYAKLLRPYEAEDAAVWERCLRCAEQSLTILNQCDTITSNSDHYFDDSIQPPSWADPTNQTVKFGRLNFYRLYLPAPDKGIPSAEFPPSSDGAPDAAASNLRSSLPPAASRALSAVSKQPRNGGVVSPSQEPPKQEPSAGRPSPANGLVSGSAALQPQAVRGGLSRNEVPHPMSLPHRVPHFAWGARLPYAQRRPRTGRLSSLKTVTGDKWLELGAKARTVLISLRQGSAWAYGSAEIPVHSTLLGTAEAVSLRFPRPRVSSRSGLAACYVSLVLLLAGCNDFERAAYRTLAVTQVEYETVQRHVAEAAAHGLITEEQWNRFAVQGHRFIDAHNAAVDAFELWSRVKNPANEARVLALLEILPRLVRELSNLAESFEKQESGVRSQESESEEALNPKLQILNKLQAQKSNFQTIAESGLLEKQQSGDRRKSRSFAALRMTAKTLGMTRLGVLLTPVS